MKEDTAIIFEDVYKVYKLYKSPREFLKEQFFNIKTNQKKFIALNKINFTIRKGSIIGIIGRNGSGKSTIAKLIAGVTNQTKGKIYINGEASMISISSGLNKNLTGRENIFYKLTLLGFTKKNIKKLIPEIIDFTELYHFIDQPVSTYSSGMKARLGFAISININPDILIIDEALAVGDQEFAEKSYQVMRNLILSDKTIIFISHNFTQIKQLCNKTMWLDKGEILAFGENEDVISQYNERRKQVIN